MSGDAEKTVDAGRAQAPSAGSGGSLRRLGRGVLRLLAQGVGIAAITFALGELASRVVLGIRPLSEARGIYLAHPRWGWAYRPDAQDDFTKLGAHQRIETNSLGLREREIPHARTAGVGRVLAIGDSATAGLEVALEDTWTRVAERRLQERGHAVEFVNAGVRGWGTDQSLLFLLDAGLAYQPDLVLYFWNDNDYDDNVTVHRPFREYGKPYFDLTNDAALALRAVPVPAYPYASHFLVGPDGDLQEHPVARSVQMQMWFRDQVVMRTAFGTALAHVAAGVPQLTKTIRGMGTYGAFRSFGKEIDVESRTFRITERMVEEMRRSTEQSGAEFRMIGSQGIWATTIRERLGFEDLGDLKEFRARTPKGTRFVVPFDTHWNELGHERYGEVLAERLEASGLLARIAALAAMRNAETARADVGEVETR